MKDATGILRRHPGNPLITVKDVPGFMTVFNPSPAEYRGQTILLLSMIPFRGRYGGQTHVAKSDDGLHFDIDTEPFIVLDDQPFPFDIMHRHVIDNRISRIGDTYYILTPVLGARGFSGPCTVLGRTTDFQTYTPMSIIDYPQVRGTSLFPGVIDGKYYKLIRPGAGTGRRGEIWLASSPDLLHWGDCRPFLSPGYAPWNSLKIGPTPPIRTREGWLVIVHGVANPCDGSHYYVGALLLDLDEPCRIIGKTYSYLLAAEKDYETYGHVGNVVFPCGALADEAADTLRLYYGAADTCVGLATGKLSDVIAACREEI